MKIKDVEYQELSEDASGGAVLLFPTPGGGTQTTGIAANLALLKHVEVDIEVRLGRARLQVGELCALQSGSMLKLDRLVDDPVEVLLNGQVVAVGQLAVLGEHLGVRITAIHNADAEQQG